MNQVMRVLHIFNEINFSGAEIMYADAAPFFQENGFELYAISTGDAFGNFTKQFEKAQIKIFHKPFKIKNLNPFYLWSYFRNIVYFIRTNQIDIIHIHRSNVFWYFSFCGYITKRKTIMTLHNVFKAGKITWVKHFLTRYTARKYLNLTFQSISRSVYTNELSYFSNPTVLINNWYDETKFYPAINLAEKQSARLKIGINDNTFTLISVGRCTDIKNHIDILKAFNIINKQAEFICLHLGSGETENHEKEAAKLMGIDDKVYFFGNKENVRDYLIASDLFIMTSKFEGLGNSCIEAMACGLPSVLYNSSGLRDLITDNDNGLLIMPDYNLLASSILKLRDPLLHFEKANNAIRYVQKNHSMRNAITSIINLYKN